MAGVPGSASELLASKKTDSGTPGGTDKPPPLIHTPRPPGWRIQIDGRTVLAVADTQLAPTPPPTPKPPLRQRMRHALRQQWRDDCDRVAKRLGYHRAENCTGWDE